MLFLLFSVTSSVIVSIILKLAPSFKWDVRQMVAGGYLVASGLCILFLDAKMPSSWPDFMRAAGGLWLLLGVLFPSLFLILAVSVNKVGIVLTDAAQRLSLLLPLIAAFSFFNETLGWLKVLGIVFGLTALSLMLIRPGRGATQVHGHAWGWLVCVFLGAGVIDIALKQMAQMLVMPFADVLLAVFVLAFILMFLCVVILYLRHQAFFAPRHVLGAVCLGGFNFANILFYIKAHQYFAQNPALVFSAMNIGVIVVGALVGLWVFKEPLNRFNKAGMVLAVLAVATLTAAL